MTFNNIYVILLFKFNVIYLFIIMFIIIYIHKAYIYIYIFESQKFNLFIVQFKKK
jgi:hypothetical protein